MARGKPMDLEKLDGKFLLVTSKNETQFYYIKNICAANTAGYNVFYQYEVFDLINNENEKLLLMDTVIKMLLTSNVQQYTHEYTSGVSVTYEIL